MFKFLINVIRIFSAVALPISGILLQLEIITKPDVLRVVVFVAAYLIINAVIELFPKRDRPLDVQRKMPSANTLLKTLIDEYIRLLTSIGVPKPAPIRANVMVIRHGFIRKYMQIAYEATPDGQIRYEPSEKALRWRKSNGAIGHVWREKAEQEFCSSTAFWKKLSSTLDKKQLATVAKVNSILSVPILDRKGENVIGIISLDSEQPSSVTYFADSRVKSLVRQFRDVLQPLCPENGVSRTGR